VQHVLEGDLRVGQSLVETLVLIDSNVALLTVPNGTERVEGLSVKFDWIRNELGELLNDLLHEILLTELSGLWEELEHDTSAALEV
jgi:hypothetical protein